MLKVFNSVFALYVQSNPAQNKFTVFFKVLRTKQKSTLFILNNTAFANKQKETRKAISLQKTLASQKNLSAQNFASFVKTKNLQFFS
jgi:hypothetical protein